MDELTGDDLTDAESLGAALERSLPGVVTTTADGDVFVFYDPDGVTDPSARFPFATVVTSDHPYDHASRLDRDASSYRVNCGVSRATYESLLGPAPREAAGYSTIETGVDYAETDRVLPHPLYSPMHWVCVVNPATRTRTVLVGLLAEAHRIAHGLYAARHERRTVED